MQLGLGGGATRGVLWRFLVAVCLAWVSLFGEGMRLVSEWITLGGGSRDCTSVKMATLPAIVVLRCSFPFYAPMQAWRRRSRVWEGAQEVHAPSYVSLLLSGIGRISPKLLPAFRGIVVFSESGLSRAISFPPALRLGNTYPPASRLGSTPHAPGSRVLGEVSRTCAARGAVYQSAAAHRRLERCRCIWLR